MSIRNLSNHMLYYLISFFIPSDRLCYWFVTSTTYVTTFNLISSCHYKGRLISSGIKALERSLLGYSRKCQYQKMLRETHSIPARRRRQDTRPRNYSARNRANSVRFRSETDPPGMSPKLYSNDKIRLKIHF